MGISVRLRSGHGLRVFGERSCACWFLAKRPDRLRSKRLARHQPCTVIGNDGPWAGRLRPEDFGRETSVGRLRPGSHATSAVTCKTSTSFQHGSIELRRIVAVVESVSVLLVGLTDAPQEIGLRQPALASPSTHRRRRLSGAKHRPPHGAGRIRPTFTDLPLFRAVATAELFVPLSRAVRICGGIWPARGSKPTLVLLLFGRSLGSAARKNQSNHPDRYPSHRFLLWEMRAKRYPRRYHAAMRRTPAMRKQPDPEQPHPNSPIQGSTLDPTFSHGTGGARAGQANKHCSHENFFQSDE